MTNTLYHNIVMQCSLIPSTYPRIIECVELASTDNTRVNIRVVEQDHQELHKLLATYHNMIDVYMVVTDKTYTLLSKRARDDLYCDRQYLVQGAKIVHVVQL